MDQRRWEQIDVVLQQALEVERSKREAFLKKACAGDVELRREAVMLLGAMSAREDLWKLYQRQSDTETRKRVINALFVAGDHERMAALAPPPTGVSREGILKLDRESLARWKDELAWIW